MFKLYCNMKSPGNAKQNHVICINYKYIQVYIKYKYKNISMCIYIYIKFLKYSTTGYNSLLQIIRGENDFLLLFY